MGLKNHINALFLKYVVSNPYILLILLKIVSVVIPKHILMRKI